MNQPTPSTMTIPLALYAWLEATALKIELAPYVKRARECDRWFVSRDGEVFGPVPFSKIMRLLLGGESPLPVLHESEAELDPAPWRTIAYRPWPRSPLAAMVWTVGFWGLAIGAGYVVVNLACPVAARRFAGPAYLVAVATWGVWLGLRARRMAASAEIVESAEAPAESAVE
jgi:hypothetical protein